MLRLLMLPRLIGFLALVALVHIAAIQPALANICRSIEAELATLGRTPSVQQRQQAGRAAQEAARLGAFMRSIGCDNRGFLIFGRPPQECAGYRISLAQLQATSQAAYGNSDLRRRQLMSQLVSANCRSSPDQPVSVARKSEPLTAGLFDTGSRRSELDSDRDLAIPGVESRIRGLAGKPVCVRLCDGYYFPLHVRGASLRQDGDALCQSLCPAAETRIYFTAREIENARAPDGTSYSDLETAFRYRKSYDATCQCRAPNETEADRRTSIINPDDHPTGPGFDPLNGNSELEDAAPLRDVTPLPGKKVSAKLFGNQPPPLPATQPPPEINPEGLIASNQGEIREIRGKDGLKRFVRVIAPELSRAPSEATAPSTQGRVRSP